VTIEARVGLVQRRASRRPTIVVRRGTNVQDCAVVHTPQRHEISAGSTVGHNCTIPPRHSAKNA
jgi:carbonic anhydrase/acetyltransferase-like protein (isoleucine patch superfamily)